MGRISRRGVLRAAGRIGIGMAAGLASVEADALAAEEPVENDTKFRVVIAGGHPGDPEYGCGGMVARLADLGHEVTLLYLNRGDLKETADKVSLVRVEEAKKACEILKSRPVFAGQVDGRAVIDSAHNEQFLRILEAERPDAVFTHWPIDNHADHRAISMLVYTAWQRMGRKFALFYYEVSSGEDTVQFAPTEYVDISKMETRKRSACFAHASQAPQKYYAMQEATSRFRGAEMGVKHAEGYVRHVQGPGFELPGRE